ncbi:endoplasmic reticulum protein [Auriculariales sp. MPI-PUGE-AT-0066]|nr:endoplasmic reticulum protein [Auriculariales sp. MPI-PUGE-AT-0066]
MLDPFEYTASLTGANTDQIKLIVSFLLNFPLGSVFIRIPPAYPALRHLFSIIVTYGELLWLFHDWLGTFVVVLTSLVTYFIAKHVRGTNMPWLVFGLTMTTLSASHIYRMLAEIPTDRYEISGAQMVLTMKLTTFAWNIYDGRCPDEELDSWQKTNRIVGFPTLLEFFGFISYFPGFQAGPAIEYAAYTSAILGAPLIPEEFKHIHGVRRMPRGRKGAAYRRLALGLGFLVAFVVIGPLYNYDLMLAPSIAQQSLWYRIFFMQAAGFSARTKYYAAWKICEGACILTGVGFSGWNDKGISLWRGASNVEPLKLETAENFKVLIDMWNIKTNQWLRECVYKRVTPKGQKPGFKSSMITFATSAFWHGFAPGYYVMFVFAGFIQTLARLCRTLLRPLVLPPTVATKTGGKPLPPPQTLVKRLYDISGVVCSILILNYVASAFQLLEVGKVIHVWSIVGWYGNIVVALGLAFFYGGGAKVLRRMQAARVKRGEHGLDSTAEEPKRVGTDPMVLPPVDLVAREAEKIAPLTR